MYLYYAVQLYIFYSYMSSDAFDNFKKNKQFFYSLKKKE